MVQAGSESHVQAEVHVDRVSYHIPSLCTENLLWTVNCFREPQSKATTGEIRELETIVHVLCISKSPVFLVCKPHGCHPTSPRVRAGNDTRRTTPTIDNAVDRNVVEHAIAHSAKSSETPHS